MGAHPTHGLTNEPDAKTTSKKDEAKSHSRLSSRRIQAGGLLRRNPLRTERESRMIEVRPP